MNKELNLQLDIHTDLDLIQEVAFKSLAGIKVSEIIKLRHTYKQDEKDYYNQIKMKYIIYLGLLSKEYKVNKEVERILFSYISHLIHELPVENMDDDDEFTLSI